MSDWEVTKRNNPRHMKSDWEVSEYREPEQMGISGVAHDAYEEGKSLLGAIPGALLSLYPEAKGAVNQITRDPMRAVKNIDASFGKYGHKLLSGAGDIRDYLEKKELVPKGTPSFRLPESILPKYFNYDEALGIKGHHPGDQLLGNTAESLAMAPLSELGYAATSRIPGISSRSIAHRLSSDKAAAQQAARQQYQGLFGQAANAGITHAPSQIPHAERLIQHTTPKFNTALQDYLQTPSLENAHWAQSELGALQRHLEKIEDKAGQSGGLTPTQNRTLRDAVAARERIRQSMFHENRLGSHPEIGNQYEQLGAHYREHVVPYNELDELSKFENHELTAKNLTKILAKNDQFRLGLGRNYPELRINEFLRSKKGKYLLGSLLSGAGFETGRKLIR